VGLEEARKTRIRNEYMIGLCNSGEETLLKAVCGLLGGPLVLDSMLALRDMATG
jgi:hypothetical protein